MPKGDVPGEWYSPTQPMPSKPPAYDKATGTEVAAVQLPAPQTGSPMTYMLDGRQYLVIAVSGPGYSGELLALRLPQADPNTFPAAGGNIVVTPVIHSSIQIEHAGTVVQIDPWSRGDLARLKRADLIVVTDDVAHHYDQEWVRRLDRDGTRQTPTTDGLQSLRNGLTPLGIDVRLAEWYPSRYCAVGGLPLFAIAF